MVRYGTSKSLGKETRLDLEMGFHPFDSEFMELSTEIAAEFIINTRICDFFNILAWKIPWTKKPRLQSMMSQRVEHD